MTKPPRNVNVNSLPSLLAALYLSVVGPSVFIIQPGFVQGLVKFLHYSDSTAGYVTSAEMWGIATTTVIMNFLSHRFNWRTILMISSLVVAAGNGLSLLATSPVTFGAVRFVTGLGSGGLISLGFTIIGLTERPDRNFGFLVMAVLTYGALALMAMPAAYGAIGLSGVLIFFGLLGLSLLPLLRFLPVSAIEHIQVEEDAVNLPSPLKAMGVATMFAYFLAQGMVWAYLFLIGTNAGLGEQPVANALTISQFLGILGAFVAAMTGSRFGRLAPVTIGVLANGLPLIALYGGFGGHAYLMAVCIYNFAWNLTHPFLLAAMASFDRQGRVVVKAVSAQMLGLAVGPAVAATVILPGNYAPVLSLGLAMFGVTLLLIWPPLLRQRQMTLTMQRLQA